MRVVHFWGVSYTNRENNKDNDFLIDLSSTLLPNVPKDQGIMMKDLLKHKVGSRFWKFYYMCYLSFSSNFNTFYCYLSIKGLALTVIICGEDGYFFVSLFDSCYSVFLVIFKSADTCIKIFSKIWTSIFKVKNKTNAKPIQLWWHDSQCLVSKFWCIVGETDSYLQRQRTGMGFQSNVSTIKLQMKINVFFRH